MNMVVINRDCGNSGRKTRGACEPPRFIDMNTYARRVQLTAHERIPPVRNYSNKRDVYSSNERGDGQTRERETRVTRQRAPEGSTIIFRRHGNREAETIDRFGGCEWIASAYCLC